MDVTLRVGQRTDAAGVPLVLYLKDRDNWGRDQARGLDAGREAVAKIVGRDRGYEFMVVRAAPTCDR